MVYNFIENWSQLDEQLENIAPANVDKLNDIFSQSLNGLKQSLRESGQSDDITNETYLELAENTYKQNDNFLVQNITNIPIKIETQR